MGLNYGTIAALQFLIDGQHIRPGGRVIEIGGQQLSDPFLESGEAWAALQKSFGVENPIKLPALMRSGRLPGGGYTLDPKAPYAKAVYEALGFTYACIDIDNTPDSIPLDLNYDQVPEVEKHKYDLVTNYGTTEHVANQLNAFAVIHDLTRVGGVMMHEVPTQGMYIHGLVSYSPKFFWMLARSNGYKTLLMNFHVSGETHELPASFKDWLEQFADLQHGRTPHRPNYSTHDATLRVILEKTYDIPFVAPLDVATGTPPTNETLAQRYWTVFNPDAFEDLAANKAVIPDPRAQSAQAPGSFRRTLPAAARQRIAMNDLEQYRNVFDGIRPWSGHVPHRFIVDFVGMLINIDFHPFLFTDPSFDGDAVGNAFEQTKLPDLSKAVTSADAEAWFEAVDWVVAAREARERYVMITLGANYGAQAVGACRALQVVNPMPYKLVAVEPVPANRAWIEQHMRNNGIDPAQQWIVPLAISDKTEPLYFPVGGPGIGSNNCYSTNEMAARKEYADTFINANRAAEALRNLLMHNTTGLMRDLVPGRNVMAEIKLVSSITLAELLGPFEVVDYLESDIQQSEILVFPPFMDLLRKKVRRIHIGTHGKDVHWQLHDLFADKGWEMVFSYEPNARHQSALGSFETNDGVLTVRNPDL